MDKQKLIGELLTQLEGLPRRDEKALDALKKRSEMYIRNIFGESSKYLKDLKSIHFYPMIYPADENYYNETWDSGVNQLKNLLQTMTEELTIFNSPAPNPTSEKNEAKPKSTEKARVFVVHGHNDGLKNEVARFLEKLGIEAIILHEKPNGGKTIIEKFENNSSSVDYAVVLLTADDEGAKKGSRTYNARARQNVVFELGYFIAMLGRSRVAALREKDVELPSDYSGVVYIDVSVTEIWQLQLAKELRDSGLDIDLNKAL